MYCNGFRVINDLLKDNGELYTFIWYFETVDSYPILIVKRTF